MSMGQFLVADRVPERPMTLHIFFSDYIVLKSKDKDKNKEKKDEYIFGLILERRLDQPVPMCCLPWDSLST